jgi:hypothetical protein
MEKKSALEDGNYGRKKERSEEGEGKRDTDGNKGRKEERSEGGEGKMDKEGDDK